MPQIIPVITSALVSFGVNAAIATVLSTAFVFASASYWINRAVKALSPRQKNGETRGQEVTITDPTAPILLCFGSVRVGGVNVIPPLTYSSDGKGRYLHQIIALSYAPHGCGGLDGVWVDNEELAAASITAVTGTANDGKFTSGDFANLIWARFYDGTQTSVDYILNTYSSAVFNSTFVGRDIAYCAFQFDFADGKAWQGVSRQMSVRFRGVKTYDPRLDTSPGANPTNTAYYSYNVCPALHLAYYLTSLVGGNFPTSEINWASVVTAADVCDALVADKDGGTQKRYTSNGIIVCSPEAFEDNVRKLCDAMLGFITYRDGQWYMRAGSWTTVAAGNTISRSDWLSIDQIVLCAGRESRYNEVKSFYVDKNNNYQRKECEPRINPTYRTEDGSERIANEIEQPLCIDESEAQRKAEFVLRKSRNGIQIAGRLPPRFSHLATFETVSVTDSVYGWSSKTFRILAMDTMPDASVNVLLVEEQVGDWTDPVAADYGQPSTVTLPTTNPTLPEAPAALTISSRPGVLDFVWPESAVRPSGTRYRLREASVSSFAVGSYAWTGDLTRAQLMTFDTTTKYYWIEAFADIAPNSGSIYPGVNSGIPYGALPWVDRREAGNVGSAAYILGDYSGLAANSYWFGISGVEYETNAPAEVRVTFTARALTNAAGALFPALTLFVQSGYPSSVTTLYTYLARQTVSSYYTDITMVGLTRVESGGYKFHFAIGPTGVAAPTSAYISFTEWRLQLEATKLRG